MTAAMIEEHTMILDMEQDMTELKDELEATRKKLKGAERLLEITEKVLRGNVSLIRKRLNEAKAEADKFSQLWRDHLDECDPQEDNDQEAEARQMLYNNGDREKQIASEGYDKSDSEYVPF